MVNFPFRSYNSIVMKKLKAAFSRLSIKKKMYLAIIPAILLLVIAFFAVFRVMFGKLRDNAVQTNYQLLSLMEKDIEKELDIIRRSSSSLVTNQYVKNYVSSNATEYDKLTLMGKSKELGLSSALNSYMVVKSPVDYVYTNFGRTIPAYEKQLLATFVCSNIEDLNGPFALHPMGASMLYTLVPIADDAYIHTDIVAGGVLVVGSSKTFLSNIAVNYGSGQKLLIYDGFGNCIYGNKKKSDLPAMGSGEFSSYTDDKAGILYVNHHLQNLNWDITVMEPLSSITNELRNYELLFLLTAIIAVTLAIAAISIISSSITKRLTEMTNVLSNIKNGDIDCRYPVVYQDEISEIGSEFNKMFDEIQTYHISASKQALRQREAELHALQSQINPHFLYNSLDCIRSAALVSNDSVAAEQIQILANMFRYTVGNKGGISLVPVSAEISHVNDYLSMLKYRFGDRFLFDVSIGESLMMLKTPKLILQPVVENSFTHGIRNMSKGGKIGISCELSDAVVFTVKDNGQGMSAERLSYLREQLSANPVAGKDTPFMGLVNTNDRIRIAFGTEYGISIESREGYGTAVKIKIPVIK